MELEILNSLKIRYRIYLLSHILVMAAVVMFFKFIPDVKTAALCAAVLFLSGPILILLNERRCKALFKSFSTYGALAFLVCSSLPIFFLRVLNWNARFDELSLPAFMGGFTGPQLHNVANYFFEAMLFSFLADAVWTTVKRYREKQKSDAV